MKVLDTRSVGTIYESLARILGKTKTDVEVALIQNMGKYHYASVWDIDEGQFYTALSIPDDFVFEGVTIHHLTTRMHTLDKGEFSIENLENTLLGDNELTRFLKEREVEFKREDGISVYHRGELRKFKETEEARLLNRLTYLKDSCVNGYLFTERCGNTYENLCAMPEILIDLTYVLNRQDIRSDYLKEKTSYLISINSNIDDIVFDEYNWKFSTPVEKTKLIMRFIITYLCMKFCDKQGYSFDNPVMRLLDEKNVGSDEIVEVRDNLDSKELFKN